MVNSNVDFLKFFQELSFQINLIDRFSKERDEYFSTKFSIFEYIETNEVSLTKIIKELLNPKGNHGQGILFLKHFLHLQNSNFSLNAKKIKIETEVSTIKIPNYRRKIDLLITIDDYAIMIENKPYASDQPSQLHDYSIHLEKSFKEKFLMIYLNKNGDNPSLTSIEESKFEKLRNDGKIVVYTYQKEILNWLENSKIHCKSSRIIFFIEEFITFIKQNLN